MFLLGCFLTLAFLSSSQSWRLSAGEGRNFLENILHFYGENSSISTQELENLLLLISARRSESVFVDNPLADQDCLSAEQILSHFGFGNVSQLTVGHLGMICPAVLTQVLLPSCPYTESETLVSADYSVWGYGFLAVTIINLASLLGLLLIPFTKKSYFPKVLTYFIGLAIGTLFSNAVLQLIPEALGFDPKADNYVGNAVGIFGGFYLLFFVEKILKLALRMDHEHGHSHFTPAEMPQDNSLHNGDITEKNDTVVLTRISTMTLDKSSLSPDQDVQGSGVMCQWLRGKQVSSIKTVAWMITLSDALHNFIDGLAIGASFTVSILTGFSTSTAIVCEEFPHELGDFVILLNSGMSIPQAIFFNLLSAVSCYVGLVFGILLGSNFAPNAIFAIAGGMFLYIALADMFPEMDNIAREQARTSTKILFFLIQNAGLLTGFTIILLITMFAGQINLNQKDSCFWVAESDGQVVATVACLPAMEAPGCLELKRMSVCRSHRRMGIAKALCQTTADFTRERGYAAVILYTSLIQTDAQKLYEDMGFKKIREFAVPEFPAKILNFTLLEYRLDLQKDGKKE